MEIVNFSQGETNGFSFRLGGVGRELNEDTGVAAEYKFLGESASCFWGLYIYSFKPKAVLTLTLTLINGFS